MIEKLHERYKHRLLLDEFLAQGVTPRDFEICRVDRFERMTCLAVCIITSLAALVSCYYGAAFKEAWRTFYTGSRVSISVKPQSGLLQPQNLSSELAALEDGPPARIRVSSTDIEQAPLLSPVTLAQKYGASTRSLAHEIEDGIWVAGLDKLTGSWGRFGEEKLPGTRSIGLVLSTNSQAGEFKAQKYVDLSSYCEESTSDLEKIKKYISCVEEIERAIRVNEEVVLVGGENENLCTFLLLSYLIRKNFKTYLLHENKSDVERSKCIEIFLLSLHQKRATLGLSSEFKKMLLDSWDQLTTGLSNVSSADFFITAKDILPMSTLYPCVPSSISGQSSVFCYGSDYFEDASFSPSSAEFSASGGSGSESESLRKSSYLDYSSFKRDRSLAPLTKELPVSFLPLSKF